MRSLTSPGVYVSALLGAVVAAILVVAAYQTRPSYDIPFGTSTDGSLLRGFNAGEVQGGEGAAEGKTFRWSTGDSYITLQDVGRQDFDVALSVDGSRPVGQPPLALTVTVGDKTFLAEQVAASPHDYAFLVPREYVEDGALVLHLTANAFSPPDDPRELGALVTRLRVTPSANPDRFIEPPLAPLVHITLTAALLSLVLAVLGWGVGGVALGGVSVGLLGAWLLIADRLWLTTGRWYSVWLPTLLVGVGLIGLVGLIGGWLLRRGGTAWLARHRRAILTLMLMAFVVRLVGQLHSQIFIVDLLFHAHRFETVQSGQWLFMTKSSEWGGGGHEGFYLPTPYVFMLPLQWLLNDELLVIKLFTVTVSTLGAFVVYFMGRRALDSGRAGLIAAALYLTVPIAVLPLSWGVTSNVFGEFFALLSLAVAVTGYEDLRPTRPAFWGLFCSLLMALLSHPGVVQLTLAAFTFISLLWLLHGRIIGNKQGRPRALQPALGLLAVLALAFGTAYAIYYAHFAAHMLRTLQDIQTERANATAGGFRLRVGGSVADKSLGLVGRFVDTRTEWVIGGLRGFWQEAQAYYRVWPIVGAALGYGVRSAECGVRSDLFRTPHSALRTRLALAALGWMLAVALFAVVGWATNLYVRYALFALPVVALGAGALLSCVWRKGGRAGALLSVLVLLFFAVEALAFWQYRITYAFK